MDSISNIFSFMHKIEDKEETFVGLHYCSFYILEKYNRMQGTFSCVHVFNFDSL